MNTIISFAPDGTGSCLYTERIDLHSLGRLEVSRASNIEFNNQTQLWEVKNLQGSVQFSAPTRQACLDWEHENL